MRRFLLLFIFFSPVFLSSCVERVLYVKGDPPDAKIYINGKEITDPTPVKIRFDYYGTFEVLVIKDGYESKKIIFSIGTPWYQLPIIDFITEVLIPFKFQDTRRIEYKLEKTSKLGDAKAK